MDTSFKSLSIGDVEKLVVEAGLPKFRAGQILSWVYAKGARSYDEMTDLPKAMRAQFSEAYPLHNPTVIDKRVSRDKSRKYVLEFEDGALVETVGLPSSDGRLSVCVSSQSGCGMRCAFCATGHAGLTRNLLPGEIIDQIIHVQEDFGQRVTNVVVMGQGEPFANYDNTLAALRIANHPKLLNIGARHVTVSTCGLTEGIRRFAEEPEQFTLAVSLHAARQEVRDTIMPGVARQRLGELRSALKHYTDATGRRFSFEYALMKDVNDSIEDLDALVSYCKRLLCHVNIIPLNEIEDSPFKPVSRTVLETWCTRLEDAGVPATIRNSRGTDIAGACGQLASKHI